VSPHAEPTAMTYQVSSPTRVIDQASNTTKQGVADYYVSVIDWIFPHVKDRPVSLIRCPDGVDGQCFYQRHMMQGKLKGVVVVDAREDKYVSIVEPEGVLTMVQYGGIEFHPWGAGSADIEHPDRFIFDLDPDPGVTWKRIQDAAKFLREQLTGIGLKPYLKLSGGKGVHLVCNIVPELDWDQVKSFAKAMVYKLAEDHPDDFVPKMSKKERKDKIFIDYLRNDRTSTAVTAYSLRAKPELPVAIPIRWEEFDNFERSDAVHVGEIKERLKKDPWIGFFDNPTSLKKAVRGEE
jgi:bifunctional non-homologous end joining protein LigD